MAGRSETHLIDIAETMIDLARRLSTEAQATRGGSPPVTTVVAETANERAVAMLRERARRRDFLPPGLFHEPAWEILLILYIVTEADAPASLKHVSGQVDAPFTTTQRWVDQLVRLGLVARRESSEDRRRVELSLSASCRAQLDAYFAALSKGTTTH